MLQAAAKRQRSARSGVAHGRYHQRTRSAHRGSAGPSSSAVAAAVAGPAASLACPPPAASAAAGSAGVSSTAVAAIMAANKKRESMANTSGVLGAVSGGGAPATAASKASAKTKTKGSKAKKTAGKRSSQPMQMDNDADLDLDHELSEDGDLGVMDGFLSTSASSSSAVSSSVAVAAAAAAALTSSATDVADERKHGHDGSLGNKSASMVMEDDSSSAMCLEPPPSPPSSTIRYLSDQQWTPISNKPFIFDLLRQPLPGADGDAQSSRLQQQQQQQLQLPRHLQQHGQHEPLLFVPSNDPLVYTQPTLEAVTKMTRAQQSYVTDFCVMHPRFGSVHFYGPCDLRGVVVDRAVTFAPWTVKLPVRGSREARCLRGDMLVEIHHCFPDRKWTNDRNKLDVHEKLLRETSRLNGHQFVDYLRDRGTWRFIVHEDRIEGEEEEDARDMAWLMSESRSLK